MDESPTQNQSVEELREMVNAQKKLVTRSIKQAFALVLLFGRITKQEMGSSHTMIDRELADFHGFTFESSEGQTMFGGNSLEIRWQEQVVLDVYKQPPGLRDGEDPVVHVFSDTDKWWETLDQLYKRRSQIRIELRAKKRKDEQDTHRKRAKEAEQNRLKEEATKLGLKL